MKGFFKIPKAINEPVKSYAVGSPERKEVLDEYNQLFHSVLDIPLYIGADEVRTGNIKKITPPHDHQHVVATYHLADEKNVIEAIETALEARKKWSKFPWQERASIFLKAAELIAGTYRSKINAATMIGQSKTIHQAEIDSACELIDFLRFNVEYMADIYNQQPESSAGIWNYVSYRPLEGFVYAVTPFNFTAISGNLPASAAMMGNVVVWKPSDKQIYSAKVIVDVFKEAGLPDGVINVVYGNAKMITETILNRPEFAGIHFTGSTSVFQDIWKEIGNKIHIYNTYPRIVGETGGKDFIIAHPSAHSQQVATAITRGGFEYQGQKCSAASRVYLPKSKSDEIISLVKKDITSFKMGAPSDFENFITAVIHEASFDKLVSYIDRAKTSNQAQVVVGGNYDKSKGYFIEPTLIVTTNPQYETMTTELFGPVVTIYVYEDTQWTETLDLVNNTSEYALTGAVFSQDRYALSQAIDKLEDAAGNFYINDKPTGAVVGQQPFGGARASGTNDKAGSAQNLLRWVSPRLIKETFVPAEDYRYPFLGKE